MSISLNINSKIFINNFHAEVEYIFESQGASNEVIDEVPIANDRPIASKMEPLNIHNSSLEDYLELLAVLAPFKEFMRFNPCSNKPSVYLAAEVHHNPATF